jgi:hypothetical protein
LCARAARLCAARARSIGCPGSRRPTHQASRDLSFDDPGPLGWTNSDIDSAGVTGQVVWNPQVGGTLRESGSDIWDAFGEFHSTQTPVTGDLTIYTTVASVENVHTWTRRA